MTCDTAETTDQRDDDPEGIEMNSEVHLVRIELTGPDSGTRAGSRRVNLGPGVYDLAGDQRHGARQTSDADSVPEDFAKFLGTVLTDMNGFLRDVVFNYAAEWALKARDPKAETSFSSDCDRPRVHDLYARLLVDFAEHHPDFLRNLLVALLTERIVINASDPTVTTHFLGRRRQSDGTET